MTTYSLQDGEGARAEHVRITGQRAATGRPIIDPPSGLIPYQPWAAKEAQFLYDEHQGAHRPENLDPVARGFMEGTPRINLQTGFQILQTPGQVVFLYEYGHHFRVVPIDGRPHLDKDVLLWMGDSRGRWEGNTLVIDVTNHNDQTWFDQVASFHSTALHVTERWTMVGSDRIDYEVGSVGRQPRCRVDGPAMTSFTPVLCRCCSFLPPPECRRASRNPSPFGRR